VFICVFRAFTEIRIASSFRESIRVFPGSGILRFCGFACRIRAFVQTAKRLVLRMWDRHDPLITEDERRQLLAHGRPRRWRGIDPLPVVRLFTPDAHATWLLAALDPADGDTAYGLIDLGIGMPELGTVKLSDLASIVGPRKQPVMRDRYFQAVRPLSEYLRLAGERFDPD
jgi:hypothetical protein